MTVPQLISLAGYERAAAGRLSPMAAGYFASGAGDEITLRRNREAYELMTLRYRVLRGVEARDTGVELLGRRHPWPLVIAPTAFARLAHPDGELAIARAAAAAGVTQTLSTLATCSLEEVASAAAGARWFQVYVFRDRTLTRLLVERAERAGYEALVVTVDAPLLGRRERDTRNRFSLPDGLVPANLVGLMDAHVTAVGAESGLFQFFTANIDASLTWDDIDWLRSITRLPLLLKGIVRGDDAALAVAHGAAGVIVSNHGGRQLDTAPATIDVLPEIAAAVAGRAAVLVDGGVRRGTDIVKALAAGAQAVLIGRPVLWGLAVDGEQGVAGVLQILRDEFELAMALCGCCTVADIGRDLLGYSAPR